MCREHVQHVSVFLPRMWSWSPTSTKSGTHAKKLEKEKHKRSSLLLFWFVPRWFDCNSRRCHVGLVAGLFH